MFGFAAATRAGVVVRGSGGLIGTLAGVAEAIENGAPTIDRKGMCGGQVLQKGEGLVAFQMLQRAAGKALKMKMIAADAVLSGRLVIAHRRARDRVSSVEALQKTLAAKRVELAVERAFGDGFFRLRRRKNL